MSLKWRGRRADHGYSVIHGEAGKRQSEGPTGYLGDVDTIREAKSKCEWDFRRRQSAVPAVTVSQPTEIYALEI